MFHLDLDAKGFGPGKDASVCHHCPDAQCLRECLTAVLMPQFQLIHTLTDDPLPAGCKRITLSLKITKPGDKNFDPIENVYKASPPPAVVDQIYAAITGCNSAPCMTGTKAP